MRIGSQIVIALGTAGRAARSWLIISATRLKQVPPGRLPLCVTLGMIASVPAVADAKAQDAEPRAYSNTPIGLNFLISGYNYSHSNLEFDQDKALSCGNLSSKSGLLA